MLMKQVLPLAFASTAAAQSLGQALAAQNGTLSVLNSLLAANPSVTTALSNAQNITILAPNDDALNALLSNPAAASLAADPSFVQALLTYHVLNGTYYASAFSNTTQFIPTLLTNTSYSNVTGGQRVEARTSGDNVTFFSASKLNSTVVQGNLNFTGGTIHVIDTVLTIPGNASTELVNANLTAAAGALKAVNLEPTLASLNDITIFAPSNDAFGAIANLVGNLTTEQLTGILGYHVINGTVAYSSTLSDTTVRSTTGQDLRITVEDGSVFVNAARVTVADILISNGVVHVINQVLNPDNSTATPDATATTAPPAFAGGSSATEVPFTSGISTPSTTLPAATSPGTSTTPTSNPGMPVKTGAVGAAALFGAGAVLLNM